METVEFRVTSHKCTPYLHTCYLLAPGNAPILICEDAFILRLIDTLSFLVDCQQQDYIDDSEFTWHMYKVTTCLEYRFTVKVWDTEEFCQNVKASINNDDEE